MIPIEVICSVAISVIELFMKVHGYESSSGWDINAPECFKDYGEHYVITVGGHALDNAELDVDILWDKFTRYVMELNKQPSAIKFAPYNLERYDHPEATYIFLSISY